MKFFCLRYFEYTYRLLRERLGDMDELVVDAHYKIGLAIQEMASLALSISGDDKLQNEYLSHADLTLMMRNHLDRSVFEKKIEASPVHRKSDILGSRHVSAKPFMDSTMIYYDKARSLAKHGDLENAEIMFQRCIFVREKKFGTNSIELSPILFVHGEFLFEIGKKFDLSKISQACIEIKRCISINSDKYGTSDESIQQFLSKLAQIYIWRSEKYRSIEDLIYARSLTVDLLNIQVNHLGRDADLTKETSAALNVIDKQLGQLNQLSQGNTGKPVSDLKPNLSFKAVYLNDISQRVAYYSPIYSVIYKIRIYFFYISDNVFLCLPR